MLLIGRTHTEGFASIKDEVFDWDVIGLNVIKAPNGHGKTKFINALFWGIFGKTLSGSVETWDFLRGKDYRGTKVEVNLQKNGIPIKIIRCKDYTGKVEGAKGKNRLIVLVDGKPLDVKDKKNIQKDIEKLIGYSPELFKNSVIFGQKLKRLITETGPNKKKVFDEAFEVTYIAKAKSLAEEGRDKVKPAYQNQLSKVNDLIKDRDHTKEKVDREEEIANDFENDRKKKIKEQQDFIDLNVVEIEGIKEDVVEIEGEDIDSKIEFIDKKIEKAQKELIPFGDEKKAYMEVAKLSMTLTTQESELSKLNKEVEKVKKYIHDLPESCDRCKRPFEAKDISAEKKRLKEELENKQKLLTEQSNTISNTKRLLSEAKQVSSSIISIDNSITSLETKKSKLEERKKSTLSLRNRQEELERDNQERKSTIEFLKGQTLKNNYEIYARELRSIQEELLKEKDILRVLHKQLKVQEWLIEDPLSNRGLKSYIFETMLEKLNDKLSQYSQYIGFQVLFDIDMESHNKDLVTSIYNGSNMIPYDDLSGGQQQSVDVVSAFAIHDVVNEGRECNLLIMDEIFESLDKNNIEIVTELIQDKAQNKALYLITHIDSFTPTNSNPIKIAFKDGVTSVAR